MTRIEKTKAAGGKPAAGLGAESANVQCDYSTTEQQSPQTLIPEELRHYDHWIVWRSEERDGDLTKVPYRVDGRLASSTDQKTWSTFAEAVDALEDGGYDGIGFVFTGSPFAGVDLDHVLNGDDLDPEAAEIVAVLNSYTERSPGGDGLHVIVEASLPDGRRRKDNVEMYDSGRYFTMTGDHWAGTPATIEERQAQLKMVHAHVFSDDGDEPPQMQRPSEPVDLSDRELIEKAMSADNGAEFRRLWEGDTSGHPSHSEADLGLCSRLVWWTGGDVARIERLFRRSGLMREKWERQDYRERTITKALEGQTDFYDPARAQKPAEQRSAQNTEGKTATETEEDADGKDKRPMKDVVLDLALTQDITLFTDQHGTPYCRTPRDQHFENLRIGSGRSTGAAFSDWLGWLLYNYDGRICSDQTLAPARRVLRAKARFESDSHELHNRTAWASDNELYYDLSDEQWRAVRITPQGWEIDREPPILFRRYAHQAPQVEPAKVEIEEAPKVLDKVFRFVNLRGEADQLLFTVYLASLLVPDIAHPMPVLHGEHGAGKTFMLKIVRQLIDPSHIGTLSTPWTGEEFVQQLSHHWLAYYDNLTSLTDWQQDTICRAVTGEGHSKRKLYSDDEDVIFTYRRCIALNGINIVSTRPDLLDRSILFELEPLEGQRRTESELERDFEEIKPKMLGALLEIVVGALNASARTATGLGRLFRLADWAAWGWRIGEALGGRGDEFIATYGEATESKAMTALALHPLGQAVLAFMQDRDEWEGTPKALLEELVELARREGIDTEATKWPGSASWVGRRLKEVRPDLRTAGITYTDTHDGTQRKYHLEKR